MVDAFFHLMLTGKMGRELYTQKSITGGIIDIDKPSRRIIMNWSALDELDFDNDIITTNAYNKTVKERGPEGADLVYWLTDHWATTDNIAGKVQSLTIVNKYLQAVGVASNTRKGNDVLELYMDGIIKQHSVGFAPTRVENAKEHRLIHEVLLFEGSSVLWGANENTPTVSVGKSLFTLDECSDELDTLMKAWKNGKYTDETFGLLEIRIEQVKKAYNDLIVAPPKSTQQLAPSTDTQVTKDSDAEVIKSLNNIKNLLQ